MSYTPPVAIDSVEITSVPDRTLYNGEDVTLTCDITLDPAVDTGVAVTVSWTGPGGSITAGVSDIRGSGPYQSTLTLSSLTTSDSGDYTCTATVDPEPLSTFQLPSEVATDVHVATVGKSFQTTASFSDTIFCGVHVAHL